MEGKNLKILMAEDNDINRRLAEMLFKRYQLDLDLVSDGEQAVTAVSQNNYDLVLMDIEMPIMGGIEATQKIKAQAGSEAPPIIALTAHAMEGDRERFLAAGLNDYLPKPIQMEALNEIISELGL